MTDYCSLSELKQAINKTTNDKDLELTALVTRASRAVDGSLKREDNWFVALAAGAETARRYAGTGLRYQRIDECVAVTKVEVKSDPTDDEYEEWSSADWLLAAGDPKRPNYNAGPYDLLIVDPCGSYSNFTSGRYAWRRGFRPDPEMRESGVPTVRVTARWGYAAEVPDLVKQATLIQAAKWWKRGESAYADSLYNPELGVLRYTKKLDPDVEAIFYRTRFWRVAI